MRKFSGVFGRLGPHRHSQFLIDARELPFLVLLRPDPEKLEVLARSRRAEPYCDARISGGLRDLLCLIDGGRDGDALFFSRNLDISGNLEAVVCLRNAIDDVDGSVAAELAAALGPPGRLAWMLWKRAGGHPGTGRER